MKKLYFLFLGIVVMFISCASGFKVDTKNVHINMVKCDDWVKLINEHKAGELHIKKEKPIKLYYDKKLQPFIEVKLFNEGLENTFYFMLDTGSIGSVITRSALKKMGNPDMSDYLFMNSYQYAPSIKGASPGYYIERLETECFSVSNILFQEMPVDELYNSLEDYPIDGILGMSILSQKVFQVDNEHEEFCFLEKAEKNENACKIIFKKSKTQQYRLITKMKIDNHNLKAYLDTGAYVTYINGNVIKRFIPKIDYIVDESYGYNYQRSLVFDNISFLDETISNVHIQSNKPSIFDNSNTIGNEILLNYNFVIDYINGVGFFTHSARIINHLKANDIIKREGPVFGFSLDRNVSPVKVVDVQLVNGVQVVPEVQSGDKLYSINGIYTEDFNWETWDDLQEADFEFWNETRMYTVHCKRKYLFPDGI